MRTAYANLLLPRALAVVVLAFFSLATLSLANKAQAQEYSVGFLEIPASGDKPKNTPPILVWYPSTTPAEAGKLGPYEVTWAQNGAIAEGAHPRGAFLPRGQWPRPAATASRAKPSPRQG